MASEASNVLRMRHNFRNWKDVNVPAVVHATAGVLMEELFAAQSIAEYLSFGAETKTEGSGKGTLQSKLCDHGNKETKP